MRVVNGCWEAGTNKRRRGVVDKRRTQGVLTGDGCGWMDARGVQRTSAEGRGEVEEYMRWKTRGDEGREGETKKLEEYMR